MRIKIFPKNFSKGIYLLVEVTRNHLPFTSLIDFILLIIIRVCDSGRFPRLNPEKKKRETTFLSNALQFSQFLYGRGRSLKGLFLLPSDFLLYNTKSRNSTGTMNFRSRASFPGLKKGSSSRKILSLRDKKGPPFYEGVQNLRPMKMTVLQKR